MSDSLLERFISESHELLESASNGILGLERNPGDSTLVDTVFRAMHTMKGSCGLFDFAPMSRVLHAAEDLLHAARDGRLALAPDIADVLFESVDMVKAWLGVVEREGQLPGDAEPVGAELAQRIRNFLPVTPGEQPCSVASPALSAPSREIEFSVDHQLLDQALVSVEYTPASNCFFNGEDPLRLVSLIPGLVDLKILSPVPFPALGELDTYSCLLKFQALSRASRAELEEHFRYVSEQVRFFPWAPQNLAKTERGLGLQLFEEQLGVLKHPCPPEQLAGRLESVLLTARNALTACGVADQEVRLELDALSTEEDHAAMALALGHLLTRLRTTSPDAPVGQSQVAATHDEATATPPQRTPAARKTALEEGSNSNGHQAFKIDQKKLDQLLELAGELVVTKNALPYLARQAETVHRCPAMAREIKEHSQAFTRLADSFHGAVMQLRVIPVEHVFSRFPRLVRDLGRKLEKRIRLVMEGESTEADKSIIEKLADPLLHLVRNAADHGLETPAEREAAGKNPEGVLRLSATQERGQMIIRVADDGRGIDPERVKRKAIEKGLITAEAAVAMSLQDALQLVTLPGFSTKESISDLSGRGVGLDVVRTAAVQCGGSLAIESRIGEGTTFTLALPLTMAVTRVLLVGSRGLVFGLPFDLVVETVRIPNESLHTIHGREATSLRGRLVPVFRLAELLGLRRQAFANGDAEESVAMLVARINGEELGLVVDSFHEMVDVILKPLEGILGQLNGYLGVSLLGDGRALLVLNLAELV